tara:strand:- start:399 stop:965 length:567 start_codon:yes stop_codon:yes gene_type:complete
MTIDLDHLKSVWKDDAPAAPDLPSIDALVQKTKYRNRITWFMVVLEVFMLTGILAMLAYLIFTSDSWMVRGLLGVSAASLIAVQIWMLRARNGLWRISAENPRQYARFHVKQAELNLKFAKFSRIAAPVGLIAGYALMSLHGGTFVTDYRFAISAFAVAGWLLFCQHWISRRKAELDSAQIIERELGA